MRGVRDQGFTEGGGGDCFGAAVEEGVVVLGRGAESGR